MLTVYGFLRVDASARGWTRDLRVLWALEEMGLPYTFRGMDHTAGELGTDAYRALNPFEQIPAIVDDGFVLSESAAILLYLAKRSGSLMPSDDASQAQVIRWCFAALNTLEPTMISIELLDKSGVGNEESLRRREEVMKLAHRFLTGLERWLEGREFIATTTFTVADILMSLVLSEVRDEKLLEPFPHVRAYRARCISRPAWKLTIDAYGARSEAA